MYIKNHLDIKDDSAEKDLIEVSVVGVEKATGFGFNKTNMNKILINIQ